MKIIRSWVGEAVVILAAIMIMGLIALGAVDRISRRIHQQLKARADTAEVQQ